MEFSPEFILLFQKSCQNTLNSCLECIWVSYLINTGNFSSSLVQHPVVINNFE